MRFKHIGDHFDKDNKHIEDWIDIELNLKKKLILTDDLWKKMKNQSRTGSFDEDDSDLAEADIPGAYGSGFSVPVLQGAVGYGAVQTGYIPKRRGMNHAGEMDADGVSDEEFRM